MRTLEDDTGINISRIRIGGAGGTSPVSYPRPAWRGSPASAVDSTPAAIRRGPISLGCGPLRIDVSALVPVA